jgi:hypothetical protein
MKSLWFVLAVILVAGVAWLGWGYYVTENRVRDIDASLPSTETLDAMTFEETEEQLERAMAVCRRVPALQWNPVSRLLRGEEIKSLAEYSEMLKARQDALHGP